MYITSIYNDNILININDLYSNINNNLSLNDYLTNYLDKKLSNKCNEDGLIIKKSIRIINRNVGCFTLNHNILYNIKYKADILFPNEGTILENCKIIYQSEVLFIAEFKKLNLIIIIPKNYLNTDLNLKKNNYINIICLDKYFEKNDNYMFIIGYPYNYNLNNISINKESLNDNICKSIFDNITQFKKDYYKLFIEKKEEIIKTQNIEYNLYDYKEKNLHPSLINLKNNIIKYIEINNITYFDNNIINNINNEINLFIIFDYIINNKNNKIYIDFKKDIYQKFDEINYKKIINDSKSINFYINNIDKNNNIDNNTDNDNIIINHGNYCYIISVLQILKNCKLFIKDFIDYSIVDDNDRNEIIMELKEILINNKNTIEEFVNLLDKYLIDNSIDFNIHNMNDINDFIYILFNIIDDNISYNRIIKNNYDNIDEKIYTDIIKNNQNDNINIILNNIHNELNNSILKYFYNILIHELTCDNCNFKSYHFENIFIHNININFENINDIKQCINLTYNNDLYIDSYECPICKNKSINRKLHFDIYSINYFNISLNRLLWNENFITKNNTKLDILSRLNIDIVDNKLSVNTIKTKNIMLDLKSIICHIGNINYGHYITINKNMYNTFYILNDDIKIKISSQDFYNNDFFKEHVFYLVYQNNIIYDLPYSNISLLEYEHAILNDYNDDIINYINNNITVGIRLGKKLLGGYNLGSSEELIDNLNNIRYIIHNIDNDILSYSKIIEAFKSLIQSNTILLNNFNEINLDLTINDNNNNTNNEIFGNFLLDNNEILETFDNYFYIYIIYSIIDSIKTNFNPDSYKKFLEPISLLYNKNIYIGSSGYNTSNTNHWDVIYGSNDNNLELYKEHFNTIEINHTYYNNYTTEHWNDILSKLNNINSSKLKLSIIFSKEISDLLLDNNNINNILSEYSDNSDFEPIQNQKLETNILGIFNKLWNNNIEILVDYIDNILFKFDSNFEYTIQNFENLKSFLILKNILEEYDINMIFEFYDEIWYNNSDVITFFKDNDLSMTTIIFNNDDNLFGNKLISNYVNNNDNNINNINNYNVKYLNNYYKVNYIKLYGNIHKYFGSHINDIPIILNYIKTSQNSKLFDKLKSKKEHSIKQQYIYFNNIEGNLNNIKYLNNDDNTEIPASIFEGRILYKLLQIFDKY